MPLYRSAAQFLTFFRYHQDEISDRRSSSTTRFTSWVVLCTPSFCLALSLWNATVRSASFKMIATSALRPSASSCTTCLSREVGITGDLVPFFFSNSDTSTSSATIPCDMTDVPAGQPIFSECDVAIPNSAGISRVGKSSAAMIVADQSFAA